MRLAVARVVWMATGLIWGLAFAMSLAESTYVAPVTFLDWLEMWSWSAALASLGVAALLLTDLAPSGPAKGAGIVVALGGIAAAVANALEDGFGQEAMSIVYIVGFALFWIGLVGLAATVGGAGRRWLAALAAVLFLGVTLVPYGGGLLILAAFAAVALAPQLVMRNPLNQS